MFRELRTSSRTFWGDKHTCMKWTYDTKFCSVTDNILTKDQKLENSLLKKMHLHQADTSMQYFIVIILCTFFNAFSLHVSTAR